MKSVECWNAIFDDLNLNRDDLWDFVWEENKDKTDVEISHYEPFTEVKKSGGGIVMVMEGKRPVYDESTRKPRWASRDELKDLFIDDWAKDKKPWSRSFRKKKDGQIVRRFGIHGGPTWFWFCVLVYEDPNTKNLTKIEYWHEKQYKKIQPEPNAFYNGKWFPPGPAMFERVF